MPCLEDITNLSNSVSDFPLLNETMYFEADERLFSAGVVRGEKIDEVIKRIAAQIHLKYRGKNILLVDVLEGGDYFYQGVKRELEALNKTSGAKVHFEGSSVKIESYFGINSNNDPKVTRDLIYDNDGKNVTDLGKYDEVVVLDDILDTSRSMKYFLETYLQSERFATKARKISASFLFEKDLGTEKNAARNMWINKYNTLNNGFKIGNWFIVGANLDLKLTDETHGTLHLFRNLPDVYVFNHNESTKLLDKMNGMYKSAKDKFRGLVSKYITEK